MSSHSSQAGSSPEPDVVALATVGLLVAAGLYAVAMFVSGTIGIVKTLANPQVRYELNAATLAAAACPLFIFAYVITPEFGRNFHIRLPVAAGATVVGVLTCVIATVLLGPSIARTSVPEFLAAAYLLFTGLGLLPTFVIARVLAFWNEDVVVARRGDHVIDPNKLTPELKRLVQKHCGASMRRPAGWQPPSLWGDAGRLTHEDIRHILALEQEEEERIAALHRQRTANAKNERLDAHHRHVLSMPGEAKALYESTLRAELEVVKGFKEYEARAEREIAKLQGDIERLQSAGAEAEAPLRARAERAEREVARIKAELAPTTTLVAKKEQALRDAVARSEHLERTVDSLRACLNELNREVSSLTGAVVERTAAFARIERLKRSVKTLEHSLQASERQRVEQGRELASLRNNRAKVDALKRSLAASERARADREREVDLLKAECVALSACRTPSETSTAKNRAPKSNGAAPFDVHRKDVAGAQHRIGFAGNNQPSPTFISKTPERHGTPQRRWRRVQYGMQRSRQGAYE